MLDIFSGWYIYHIPTSAFFLSRVDEASSLNVNGEDSSCLQRYLSFQHHTVENYNLFHEWSNLKLQKITLWIKDRLFVYSLITLSVLLDYLRRKELSSSSTFICTWSLSLCPICSHFQGRWIPVEKQTDKINIKKRKRNAGKRKILTQRAIRGE